MRVLPSPVKPEFDTRTGRADDALTARVLADAFKRVAALERDPLDADTGVPRGVPRGHHVHVLLAAAPR